MPLRETNELTDPQAKLDRGESADEVAQALYRESRGEKHDHFDGPILYRDPPVPI
jgi:hypothetical protein